MEWKLWTEDKILALSGQLREVVGSGEAVGGMVSADVGRVTGQEPTQLQRIVARCSCEFYFVSFSPDLDPVAEEHAANIPVGYN